MNCRPNELAMVVRRFYTVSYTPTGERYVVAPPGTIVRVVRLRYIDSPDPTWLIETPIPFTVTIASIGQTVSAELIAIEDAFLKPLRNDPGEDITLSWKAVPTKQGVPA